HSAFEKPSTLIGYSPRRSNCCPISSAMAWICLGLLPLQTTKKSAKLVTSRKSSTRISNPFFDSAARTAVSQVGVLEGSAIGCATVLWCCRIAKDFSYFYATLKFPMRQLLGQFLSLGAVILLAASGLAADDANAAADRSIQLAQQELTRIQELAELGALPRARVEQAQANLEDAKDEAIVAHDLYGDLPDQDATEQASADLIAAAERRRERQKARVADAQKM